MLKGYPLIIRVTILLFFIILLFYTLRLAENLLAPLCLSVLLAYMLYPVVNFLEQRKVNRIIAILISIAILLVLVNGIILIIIRQIDTMISDLPDLKAKAIDNITLLTQTIEDRIGISSIKQQDWIKERIGALFESGSDFVKRTFSATATTIFKLAILPVFIFYLLYYRDHFRAFILRVIPEDKKRTAQVIMKKLTVMTINYMGGVFVVVLILSILNTVGLTIIGIRYAATFGIISALFNFIPYFGNWIGASLPLLFALLTGETPNLALAVLLLYIIVQFLEHNVLTPNITGVNVNLNPIITILGIIIAGAVWGIIGMFIIIPVMAMVKIIFEYFENLQPYAMLLGIKEDRHDLLGWKKMQALFTKKRRRSRTKDL